MKVKALADCFVAGVKRKTGATFEFTPPVIDGKEILYPKILEPVVPMRHAAPAAAPAKDKKEEKEKIAFGALLSDK